MHQNKPDIFLQRVKISVKKHSFQFFWSAFHLKRATSCPLCCPALYLGSGEADPRATLGSGVHDVDILRSSSFVHELKLQPNGLSRSKLKIYPVKHELEFPNKAKFPRHFWLHNYISVQFKSNKGESGKLGFETNSPHVHVLCV